MKEAYLRTLFRKKDRPLESVYRVVGKSRFLYTEQTIKVMGYMPIHVAKLLARLEDEPKFSTEFRDHYETNPDEGCTKERLAEVITSLSGSSGKQRGRSKNRVPLAEQISTTPEQN